MNDFISYKLLSREALANPLVREELKKLGQEMFKTTDDIFLTYKLSLDPTARVVIAISHELVGARIAYVREGLERKDKQRYIQVAYSCVREKYQGQGVASRMFDIGKEIARNEKIRILQCYFNPLGTKSPKFVLQTAGYKQVDFDSINNKAVCEYHLSDEEMLG